MRSLVTTESQLRTLLRLILFTSDRAALCRPPGNRRQPCHARRPKKKYGPTAQKKVHRAMHERKNGTLKSGRSGKKVTSRKQAIAIGLSEARKSGAKIPRKKVRVASIAHQFGRMQSRGSLSSRSPRKTGWRSLPSAVHSANAICATSFGASQVSCFSRGGSTNGAVAPNQRLEHPREVRQPLLRKAGADFSYKMEIIARVCAQQQRADMLPRSLRRGESRDDEFLFLMDLHLQPVSGCGASS